MSAHSVGGPRGLCLAYASDEPPFHFEPLHDGDRGFLEWAYDEATGQRFVFDWKNTARGWQVDADHARFVAARKAAILRRRGGQ